MTLNQFLQIFQTYFDDKVPIDDSTKRRNNATRLQFFMNVLCIENGESDNNSIYRLSEDYLRKIYSGNEKLPINVARYYKGRISKKTFHNFIHNLETETLNNMIFDFNANGEFISKNNFEQGVLQIFEKILNNIIYNRTLSSIRNAEFLCNNSVKINKKIFNLAPDLIPSNTILDEEYPYINALLNVYAQKEKVKSLTLDDLKKSYPKYDKHLQHQRKFFFSAESVLYQIKDLFPDGILEFNNLKKEVLNGIQITLFNTYKNALERVNATLEKVTILVFGKSYLSRENVGLIGTAEKQGIIHILVNEGKIEWIQDYDTDIEL